jgi:glucose-1-phosphate thymidylyltransferase
VKALILAAGYATRLRPLTDSIPKMLLPLAERPMLDYLLDRIREVDDLDEIDLVTNARFAGALRDWAPEDVTVLDDGTTSNEDRLGAIGDIAFAIERGGLEGEDLLVVAGDNLIGYSLADFVDFGRAKGGSALAVHEVADRSLLRNYGVVQLDEDERVVGLEEKPAQPKGDLAATASYLYRGDHLALRTLRATSWPGCTPASPSTATAPPANGTTSATSASCWPRTTCSASGPVCRRGPNIH